MDEAIIERIQARIDELGTSHSRVSEEAGHNAHLLQKVFKGHTKDLTVTKFLNVAEAMNNTSPGWLLTGIGEADSLALSPGSFADWPDEAKEKWRELITRLDAADHKVVHQMLKAALIMLDTADMQRSDVVLEPAERDTA